MKIDIPRVIVHLRGRVVAEGAAGASERAAMRALAWTFGGERRYRRAQQLGRAGSRPFTRGGLIQRMPGLGAWTDTRDLPPMPRQTFRDWWDERRA